MSSSSSRFLSFKNFLAVAFLAILFTALSGWWVSDAQAQDSAGVRIKPANIDETLDPGTSFTETLTIENLDNTEQTFYLFTRNISRMKQGGVPVFASSNLEVTGYELADWIELPLEEITLAGGEETTLEIEINVPEDASPGGHFGGVFVSVEAPEFDRQGAAVGYQVSNLVDIRVTGDVIEEAIIRQFSTDKFLYGSQNVNFTVSIENRGNVLIRPFGPLEIYNMLGNKVGEEVFNEDTAGVFPNDARDFEVEWKGDSIGFGRYEAVLSAVYGDEGAKKTMSNTASFWILPMSIVGPAVIALAVLFLIIFVFVKLYIRRSLAHLNQGNRRIVQRRRKKNSSATLLLIVVTLTVTALFLIVLLALFA